jgi:hypothetical protein
MHIYFDRETNHSIWLAHSISNNDSIGTRLHTWYNFEVQLMSVYFPSKQLTLQYTIVVGIVRTRIYTSVLYKLCTMYVCGVHCAVDTIFLYCKFEIYQSFTNWFSLGKIVYYFFSEKTERTGFWQSSSLTVKWFLKSKFCSSPYKVYWKRMSARALEDFISLIETAEKISQQSPVRSWQAPANTR